MYRRVKITQLDDYFKQLSARQEKGVYFYRVTKYNGQLEQFLYRYLEAAKRSGVVIAGKIPNPDENQLSYYEEMMGLAFAMDPAFFDGALKKWLPRLDNGQRKNVVNSLYHTLSKMQQAGKNENILKNAYIKFMCWFYYKFERILKELGQENVPKILYEGTLSNYELKMFSIIAEAGCDIILLEKEGDAGYLRLDPDSKESYLYDIGAAGNFPPDFTIKNLEKGAEQKTRVARLFNDEIARTASTNTWITGEPLIDALKAIPDRGQDKRLIYNLFIRMAGVDDKATYCNDLFHFKQEVEKQGRNIFVLDSLTPPTMEEISMVNKNNYNNVDQLLMDLTGKMRCTINNILENQIRKSFAELIMEESKEEPGNMNKLKNKAIYIVCWYLRYEKQLFNHYNENTYGMFVYFGTCKTKFESLFLRFLSKLPLDVLVINPNMEKQCKLEAKNLFEKRYENSMELERFPIRANDVSYGTAAYHAEQDLTQIMYQDSGMYRTHQYKNAVAISLQTMYEEMYILWDQEAVYRPNFETIEDKVVLPVMISKVCGVKDGNVTKYWQDVKKLVVEDTMVITRAPYINPLDAGSIPTMSFIKNRKLQRQAIKNHPAYRFRICREEIQEYILDKIEEVIDSGIIAGTYTNGMEYRIVSVVLSMNQDIMRLIQKFDFTKKLPKLIFIDTNEAMYSQDDAIMIAFLHKIGFDIVMFVPTGYQVIEQFYTGQLFVDHQIGEYMYDLHVPNLNMLSFGSQKHGGLMNKIFRRG